MLIDVVLSKPSLAPRPEDYLFTLDPKGNTTALDVFKSLLASNLSKKGKFTMTVFDFFVFRRKMKQLNLWGSIFMSQKAIKVAGNYIQERVRLEEIKQGSQNDALSIEGLKSTPYKDQKSGTCFHLSFDRSGNFSEMGVGKTFTSLTTINEWYNQKIVRNALVICKNNGKSTWAEEIQKHTNFTSVAVGNGTKTVVNQIGTYFESNNINFLVIHYDCLSGRKKRGQDEVELSEVHKLLKGANFDAIILDEVHKIKNHDAARTIAVADIVNTVNPRKMLILTGTPVSERPEDAYILLQILKPEILPSRTRFMNYFCEIELRKYSKKSPKRVPKVIAYKNLEDLRNLIDWVSFRKRQEEVEGMPEKIFREEHAQLTKKQIDLYNAIREDTYKQVAAIPAKALNLQSLGVKLLRLRQLLTHPMILGENCGSGKFDACDDLLEEIMSNKDAKAIVWSTFIPSVELLTERYSERYGAEAIYGEVAGNIKGTKTSVRDDIRLRFNNDKYPRVLICSPAAAGDSLNLQRARNSIYVDRPVVAIDWKQSLDRIQRREAKGTSVITTITVPNTVDDWVTDLLGTKQNREDALLLDEDRIKRAGNKESILKILERPLCAS